jgi:hypothetical protein
MSVVIAILAKDKECTLPFYLDCIYQQTYDKKNIHLYIRTNDNRDKTADLLLQFVYQYGSEYASVYYDDRSVSEQLKNYSNHEWNVDRFHILGKIRQESVDYAKQLNAHYFVIDCDNFIVPETLERLMRHNVVIAPLLNANKSMYSNYHYSVDGNGYFAEHEHYHTVINRQVLGLFQVECIHCTYLIPFEYLDKVLYDDGSCRYEYVIFSSELRKHKISQYIDNSFPYGFLTFATTTEDFDRDYNDMISGYPFQKKHIQGS